MSAEVSLEKVKAYFEQKLATHGATPQGVDWNSKQAQERRFEQLLKVVDTSQEFSINDYGCGYGALLDYLSARGYWFRYAGFDLLEPMVARARELHAGRPDCHFSSNLPDLATADYNLASGIFNVKLETEHGHWTEYILSNLDRVDALSRKGFAFNLLTKYSDPALMRSDLYYGDPGFFFDYFIRRFSKKVALLHDYGLYDFTLLVRKEPW